MADASDYMRDFAIMEEAMKADEAGDNYYYYYYSVEAKGTNSHAWTLMMKRAKSHSTTAF